MTVPPKPVPLTMLNGYELAPYLAAKYGFSETTVVDNITEFYEQRSPLHVFDRAYIGLDPQYNAEIFGRIFEEFGDKVYVYFP